MEMAVACRQRLVIVADDDAEMRALIAQSLRHHGFDVIEVADGDALLAQLHQLESSFDQAPDLVISDVHMPGASGLEVLAQLHGIFPGVPMVMMTASGGEKTRTLARQLGAAAVLDKPFELSELHETVLAVIEPVCV